MKEETPNISLQAELEHKQRLLDNLRTDLKETQQQLLQAEKMASVGQLAAGVAHEINNPVGFVASNLTTLGDYIASYQQIVSQVHQLASAKSEPEKQTAAASLVALYTELDIAFISEDIDSLIGESSEGLTRISEIVKGLKLFSRVDSDDKQWFDINDCMRTTLSMVNNKLKYICELNLALTDVPRVFINVGKITQIFTNLLINAGQAIETTGRQGKITIKSWSDSDKVFISVADTGCGVPQAHLDKLFNPFFTTKPEGQGTGLGLSISQGIAEEHGGHLRATSEEGKGSCFVLSLPISEEEPDDLNDDS